MSVNISATPVAAYGDILGVVKVQGEFPPIVGTAGMPRVSINRPNVLTRTIHLYGGGFDTPEYLDDSLESGFGSPYVKRSAAGNAPGKPVWGDAEEDFLDYRVEWHDGDDPPDSGTGDNGDYYLVSE